jgi:uncharacterized protein (TIGR02145 family)
MNKIKNCPIILFILLITVFYSCKKSDEVTAIKDADGNVYTSTKIGTQEWLVENLKTTKYNDGTDIPLVTDASWWTIATPAYRWYKNDPANYKTAYGALYNWFAVTTGNLCPTGWHVPDQHEWSTLIVYLGGVYVAGGKLKESGTVHWKAPNLGATNESGFTAMPTSSFSISGLMWEGGIYSFWWTATQVSYEPVSAYSEQVNCSNSQTDGPVLDKHYGLSVRCLKD